MVAEHLLVGIYRVQDLPPGDGSVEGGAVQYRPVLVHHPPETPQTGNALLHFPHVLSVVLCSTVRIGFGTSPFFPAASLEDELYTASL